MGKICGPGTILWGVRSVDLTEVLWRKLVGAEIGGEVSVKCVSVGRDVEVQIR